MPDVGPTSYSDPFDHLFAEIRMGLLGQLTQLEFFAEVISYDALSAIPTVYATVRRYDSTVDEGPYRVASHVPALVAGDRVKVRDTNGEGGFVVEYKLA